MIKRLLLIASTVCTLIVVASFVMFALEKANASSTAQQNKIVSIDRPDPTPQAERLRATKHTKVRELVDDANDVLTKPFDGITTSNDIWVERGVPVSAIPVACAPLAFGFPEKAFIVRKERKEHGLQRWIEGPLLGEGERCLIVEDVVTTGGSTVEAVERVKSEGLEVAGVVCVLDRLAGGGDAISAAIGGAPYVALTTIDDVYPDRPDR